jgi:hypothetical protein
MLKLQKNFRAAILLMLCAITISSCVKKEFDEPVTANVDPAGVVANATVADLIALSPGFGTHLVDSNYIVSAVVVGDDESGNIYKQIIVQDSTGGIAISVDITNFHTIYPVGRRLFIKCKGLYIANDGDNNYELGIYNIGEIGRIPSSNVGQFILRGKWGIEVEPKVYLMNATNIPTNTLIKLENVEFDVPNQTYANAATLSSKNLDINDCSGHSIVLYTSGFAKFASALTPSGNGSIIAIYKEYSGDGELILRNLADIKMDSVRCNGTSGNNTLMPIDSLRMSFPANIACPLGRKIKGIVISDNANGNTQAKNMVLQDGTGGIVVRFTANHNFALNTEVEVNISGEELTEYNGWLEVNNVPLVNATVTGSGTVVPRVATIAQILANFDAWESTLVQIQNVTITGTGIYSQNQTLTDATGTMVMYTSSSASFANTSYPTGNVNVTGVLSEFTTSSFYPQLNIRNTSDVQ